MAYLYILLNLTIKSFNLIWLIITDKLKKIIKLESAVYLVIKDFL